jgi:hypothetical protein
MVTKDLSPSVTVDAFTIDATFLSFLQLHQLRSGHHVLRGSCKLSARLLLRR